MILLFDFLAAFPSVAHAWIRDMLNISALPLGFQALADVLYKDAKTYCGISGVMQLLAVVTSGVLQGCPLSVVGLSALMSVLSRAVKAEAAPCVFDSFADDGPKHSADSESKRGADSKSDGGAVIRAHRKPKRAHCFADGCALF